jgi:hypothetical protein
VFEDLNADGVMQSGDTGESGVGVTLKDMTGATVASTTSDSSGNYEFSAVDPGEYTVNFDVPTGMNLSTGSASQYVMVLAGHTVAPINAGLYAFGSVSGLVWEDANGNGTRDTGEAPSSGVLVTLNDLFGDPVGYAETDSNGAYSFPELVPGDYQVAIEAPDGSYFTKQDQGTDDTIDSDVDRGDGTLLISLQSGQSTSHLDAGLVDNAPPVGVDDVFLTDENQTLLATASGVLVNDTDPEDDSLIAQLLEEPAHGALTLNADGSFAYVPDADFTGIDFFTYRPSDDFGLGSPATVTILTGYSLPTPTGDTASTDEDTPVTISVLDNDPNAVNLKIAYASDGAHGTTVLNANGTITYTPNADWTGTDSFIYWVKDTVGGVSPATVSVTLNSVNDTPDAVSDTRAVLYGTASTLGVLVNDADPDGDALTITQVTQPSHGTVTITGNGTDVTYTPASGYSGADSFTYTVSDGHGGTDTATVSITVTPYVRITAFANPLVEGEGGADVFTIQRFGDVSQALTVYLTFTALPGYSFATPGADFVPAAQSGGTVSGVSGSGGTYTMSVTFAAGSSFVAIDFAPIEDYATEGMEGVLLTLSSVPTGWAIDPDNDTWGLLIEDGEGGA